jgi:hypothetical protein
LRDSKARRTKGLSYAKLCDLAQALAFIDAETVASDDGQQAQQLFRDTLADPKVAAEVAAISPIWINSPHRQHGGIFVAGTIVRRSVQRDLDVCMLDTGTGSPLVILVPGGLPDGVASMTLPVAVVGVIVDDPTKQIRGYTGSAAQSIWAASLLPLE